jgi:hypothetical protein
MAASVSTPWCGVWSRCWAAASTSTAGSVRLDVPRRLTPGGATSENGRRRDARTAVERRGHRAASSAPLRDRLAHALRGADPQQVAAGLPFIELDCSSALARGLRRQHGRCCAWSPSG